MLKSKLKFIIKAFLIWIPIMAVQKPLFMLYNQGDNAYAAKDYIDVILHGLRLDCSVAGYLTIVPMILALISVWGAANVCKKILNIYFVVASIIVALIFAVDMALYEYWGFRLDATLFFYLRQPKEAMASVPIGQFLAQSAVFLIYGGITYYLLREFALKAFKANKATVKSSIVSTACLILMGGLIFVAIRSSVTTATANVGMVYYSNDLFLNHSAINPCFSMMASISKQQDFAKQFDFFDEAERQAIFDSVKPLPCDSATKVLNTDRPNVLIVILEGFSANAIGSLGGEEGITPCIDELAKEGILFTNAFANSFRTDRGTVAVLNGYLAQPTTSIMKYPAKSQTLPAIAKSLSEAGYMNDVLYGGDINFTNMRSYFFNSGYNKLTADVDFPIKDRTSKWGVNDDLTFRHLYEDIANRDTVKPWHTMFLTLSSHEPYIVPYHKLKDPYANTVAFADSCLGDFISKFKQLPSWKNSLVIFVADHGYRYPADVKEYEPRRFHIPMLWVGGAIERPMVIDRIVNQTDLAATLLSQLGLPHDEFTFSKDIFCPSSPEYAFFTFPNCFGWIDKSGATVVDNESGSTLLSSPAENEKERVRKGKALLQTLYDDLGAR